MKKILTMLSFGGGQDSWALLLLYANDPAFRTRYAPGEFIVVMSDTGNEHGYTLESVQRAKRFCLVHKIQFFYLTPDQGYHTRSWQSLVDVQNRPKGSEFKETMVQLGTKSCTINLKVGPIYKFLDEYLNSTMGYGYVPGPGRGVGKRAIKRFGKEGNDLRILIGFAYGEEKRADKANKLQAAQLRATTVSGKESDVFWKYVRRYFPLIDLEMDRASCQHYIAGAGEIVPMPSNCMMCPYMAPEELYWLYLNDRSVYDHWVAIEARKIKRFEGMEKNHGVFGGKVLIPEKLEKVKAKYSHLSEPELLKMLGEHKMNHGCGSSAY